MKTLDRYRVSVKSDIRSAVKQLELSGIGSLIVENNGQVVGLFTIGDFRRAVLKGLDINSDLLKVVNTDFIYLEEHYSEERARSIFRDNNLILDIPILNSDRQLLSVIRRQEILSEDEINNIHNIQGVPVVIMAGGKGKRMDPFTRILPKPLIPLGNDPIIKFIIDNFANYKAEEFYISLNDKEWMVKAYFHDHSFPYDIKYIIEDKPLGTAGALNLLHNVDFEHIFVSNCDVIVNTDYASIYKYHLDAGHDLTIVGCMKQYTIPYGVCSVSTDGKLESMQEKPEYDFLVNTGLYLIKKDVISLIPTDTYYDMNSLIEKAMTAGMNIGVFPVSDKSWMDVGQWNEYSTTMKSLSL